MARILIIVVFMCLAGSIYAQPPSKNFLYINDKDKYVLSETAEIKDGYGRSTYQTFNSLFIWQKDKVVRIVFKYLKRMRGPVSATHQQLFSRFIPPFKKYTIYARAVSHPAGVYDGEIVYGKKSEYNSDNYTELFKTAINNWNRKYNPYADMLGGIIVLDGYSDPLSRNEKRKAEYNNNLPLLFTHGDSSYLIKPYLINVYRLSSHDHIPAAINGVVCYKLYSTVSLMEDSFPDFYQEHSFPYYESFIDQNTLPRLYKMNLSLNTDSLSQSLASFPFAEAMKYDLGKHIELEPEPKPDGDAKEDAKELARIKRLDSIKAVRNDSLRKIFEADCFGHYQYCPECYNNNIPKTERIKMHCPLQIGKDTYENWSYAFSANNRNYFKVETREFYYGWELRPPITDDDPRNISEYNYPVNWILMTPGAGYWMADVAKNSREYFKPEKSKMVFLLNGKAIY